VQPTKLKTGEVASWVREQNVDVALVVAYGRILPRDILDGPRRGCVNVHASLLPKYRGAAPIQWSVADGNKETGVSLMVLDEGMDTGGVLATLSLAIGPDETAGELSERLAALGAEAVRRFLPAYVAGTLEPTPQDHGAATHARPLTKEDGRMDFARPATRVHDHVRAMAPWPGAFTSRGGKVVKVHATRVVPIERTGNAPGTVLVADKSRVLVACSEGAVELLRVQLEGKKPMTGSDWALGRGVLAGDVLGA
jgi:methionyl-tRNA formyltransferase